MPQFDFSTYSSQIFWFVICFSFLYTAMHFVILPRIKNIISERKKIIDNNNSIAENLFKSLDELSVKSESIRRESSKKYQQHLESSYKKANEEREKSLDDLKVKLDDIYKKSQEEIDSFVKNNESKKIETIKELTLMIKSKIFN